MHSVHKTFLKSILCTLVYFIVYTSPITAQQILIRKDTTLLFNQNQLILKKGIYQVPKQQIKTPLPKNQIISVKIQDSTSFHFGFVNEQGKFIIPPIYDSIISILQNNKVIVGKYFPAIDKNILFKGILSSQNYPIVPVSFVEIDSLQHGIIPAKDRKQFWAIFDTNGRQIHEPEFDSIRITSKDGIWVRKQGKWGLINKSGKFSIALKYKNIEADTGNYALVTKFPTYDYTNIKSEIVLTCECDSIKPYSKGYFVYYQNEKCGLRSHKEDSKAIYNYIGKLINQRAVAYKNGYWGMLDPKGKTLLPFQFDSLLIDHSEFIRLKIGNYWGLIDAIQFPKIPARYKKLKNFSNGLIAALGENNLWGYLNIVGDTSIPFLFKEASDFNGGLATVRMENEDLVINKKGEIVVYPADMPRFSQGVGRVQNNMPVKYNFPIDYYERYKKIEEGITLVYCENKYGILGKDGNELFPAIGDTVVFDEIHKVAIFHCDTMAGVVDRFNNYVHPMLYNFDTIHTYSQGCALARKNGYYGGIDLSKNIRIAPQYERMQNFHDGKWGITLQGKWGFTDLNEKIIVQPNYDTIQPFNGQAGGIKYKGKWNLVSAQDKILNTSYYDSIAPTPFKSWILFSDGKQGLTDTLGQEMIVCRYDSLTDLGNGWVQVWKNGKTGVLDKFQNFLMPIIYDQFKYDQLNQLFIFSSRLKRVLIK